MAINFTDFTNAKTHQSGLRDLLANVLKGYQLSKMPGQMRQEEEQRGLRNEKSRLSNSLLGYKNEYAPQQYEQEAEQRDLVNQLSRINVGARPGEIDRKQQQDEMKIEMLSNKLGVQPELIRLALQQKEAELAKIQGENEYAPNKRALEEEHKIAQISKLNQRPDMNQPNIYEQAKIKAQASQDAKSIAENDRQRKDLHQSTTIAQQLVDKIKQPLFKSAIGVGSKAQSIRPDIREFRSEIDTLTGALAQEKALLVGGNITEGEWKRFEKTLPSSDDYERQYIAKANETLKILENASKRAALISKYTSQGYPYSEAVHKSIEEIDLFNKAASKKKEVVAPKKKSALTMNSKKSARELSNEEIDRLLEEQ
jgi:hypothetical protein